MVRTCAKSRIWIQSKILHDSKEVQKLLLETDDMRTILEDKIVEVENLQAIIDDLNSENQVLKNNCKNHQNEL